MINASIYKYLTDQKIPVHASFPKEVPETAFCVMQQIDGTRSNQIEKCTFAFTSYAGSLYEACELNEEVKNALYAFVADPSISHVDLGGESSSEDAGNHLWKQESIMNFVYYGG